MKKLALVIAITCLATLVPAVQALDLQPVAPQAAIMDIFDYINDCRVENGLPKLTWNDELADITEEHSRKMHDLADLNHFIQGKGPEDRLNDAGIKWSCYVENITYNKGQPDKAKAAFETWKKSDGHRKNMLDSCVTEGAVGYTGCDMMGHYFTFMAVKQAGDTVTKQDPIKISLPVGSSSTTKITLTNPNQNEITLKIEVALKPVGVRFGVGPAELNLDPGKSGQITLTVGAENSNPGTYEGEIHIIFDGGKMIYPVSITVTAKQKKSISAVMWVGKKDFYVNDKKLTTTSPPTIVNNSTVVGARMITDIFGGTIDYDAATKTVTIKLDNIVMKIQVGNKQANINGIKVSMSQPPVIIGGRTYVPVRFIVENLGGSVSYEAASKKISIKYEK
jgi:uncharacterized protein YkwD